MSVRWLFAQYEFTLSNRYADMVDRIYSTEQGVFRALYAAFQKKANLPEIPTYKDLMAMRQEAQHEAQLVQRSDFVDKVQRANKLGPYREAQGGDT